MELVLDRMAVEEAGPNPERLAAAIHAQLPLKSGAVPVAEIANALDIVEIREKRLASIEGALITTPERDVGMILVNSASALPRRRYTTAHELGHFLNLWHRPADSSDRFLCTKADLATPWGRQSPRAARHHVQESEANCFAIELLAPKRLIRPYLCGIPDLEKVLALSDMLLISREAGARRYVESHRQSCALVFSRHGLVRYVERNSQFPFVSYGRDHRLPELAPAEDGTGLSSHVEVEVRDWLTRPNRKSLVAQTLHQREGYAMTLLAFDAEESDQSDEE